MNAMYEMAEFTKLETVQYRVSLNANSLKLIAVCAMALDHWATVFWPANSTGFWYIRMAGRIASPIMCFFIAEGYHYTSDLKRYIRRLLLFAVISHIPYNLCFGHNIFAVWESTDVMVSLLMGLIALSAYQKEGLPKGLKCLIITVCCLLAYSADWNYIAVFWILGFGIFHKNIRMRILSFTVVACGYLLQLAVYQVDTPLYCRLGVFLAIPFFLMYNGEMGRKSKMIKWGYYWFYPLHLVLLFVMQQA